MDSRLREQGRVRAADGIDDVGRRLLDAARAGGGGRRLVCNVCRGVGSMLDAAGVRAVENGVAARKPDGRMVIPCLCAEHDHSLQGLHQPGCAICEACDCDGTRQRVYDACFTCGGTGACRMAWHGHKGVWMVLAYLGVQPARVHVRMPGRWRHDDWPLPNWLVEFGWGWDNHLTLVAAWGAARAVVRSSDVGENDTDVDRAKLVASVVALGAYVVDPNDTTRMAWGQATAATQVTGWSGNLYYPHGWLPTPGFDPESTLDDTIPEAADIVGDAVVRAAVVDAVLEWSLGEAAPV